MLRNTVLIEHLAVLFSLLLALCRIGVAAPLKNPQCEKKYRKRDRGGFCISDAAYSAKGFCYFHLAIKSQEIGYCASIPDRPLDGMCVERIAITKKDYKLCYDVRRQGKDSLEIYYEHTCLIDYASINNEPSVCNVIWDGKPDPSCVEMFKYRSLHPSPRPSGH